MFVNRLVSLSLSLSIYIYIYMYHHDQFMQTARIFLTPSLSLSFFLSLRPYHPTLLAGLPNYIL